MSIVQKQITEAYKTGGLICITLNKIVWNRRIIGFVKTIYASAFKLEIVDEWGQRKPAKTFQFDAIKALEIGGIYNDNLEKLSKAGWEKTKSKAKYAFKGKNNLHNRLQILMEAEELCTFFFNSEYSIGKVTYVTQDEFCIANIGYDAIGDGTSVFDLPSLTKIRWASDFERRISFLKNGK